MNEFTLFSDVRYLIYVIVCTGGLSLITFSPGEILINLKFALNGHSLSPEALRQSKGLWDGAARNAFIFGVSGAMIKLLLLFENLGSAEGSSGIGDVVATIAAGIQPVFYGLALACVFMILAWRKEQKMKDSIVEGADTSPHPFYGKVIGYLMMIGGLVIVFFGHSVMNLIVSWPLLLAIIGGTLFVYLISKNKFSVTPALGILGFVAVLLGLNKMLFAMGIGKISLVATAMLTMVISLFYILLGVLYVGIPLDDFQIKQGREVPLLNKLFYILIPIMSLGIYLFTFMMIITPITKKM